MIDASERDLKVIKEILKKHVPDTEVRAFGSRVSGTAKSYSDLDLVIMGREPIRRGILAQLKEVFQESGLPFRVDLMDWNRITPEFQNIIAENYIVIQG